MPEAARLDLEFQSDVKREKQNHDTLSSASSNPRTHNKANHSPLLSVNQEAHPCGLCWSVLWRVSQTCFLSKVSCRCPLQEGAIIRGYEGYGGRLVLAARLKYLRVIIRNKPKDRPKLNLKPGAIRKNELKNTSAPLWGKINTIKLKRVPRILLMQY